MNESIQFALFYQVLLYVPFHLNKSLQFVRNQFPQVSIGYLIIN